MSVEQTSTLVVITPVYEDLEPSTRPFVELAVTLGQRVRVIAVDDGSVRHPVDPESIARAGREGVVIRLKRNVGHQRAIAMR